MKNDFDDLWDYQNPQQTRENFTKLLPLSDENLNLQLKTQIARTYSLQRNFTEAHKILDEVQQQLPASNSLTHTRYFLERGRTFNSAKKREEAVDCFHQASEISRKNNHDFYSIDALHMLAIAVPQEAMSWNLQALELAENTCDERAKNWCGSLYNNIGWAYFETKDYEKALTIFRKTKDWYAAKNDENYTLIAEWSIGKVLRMQNKISQALEVQHKLEKIYLEKQQDEGYVCEELAECYLQQQNPKYKDYAQRAYDELSKDVWLQNNEASRLQRLKELAL
ncbi:tetratricopeptide repeat protein [Candidatus Uabimicrobium amorphum]|uniref:Tetratricopeptide repeat protein n=1 Tax=Uabimicrobium amorphum TaxID=2596890 RepID=A0A5S9IHU5_UABAM|nr:tetratricopeptide repeat protein [Candidatus Uabimicrobium amorphum]BBM81857.1 hypothetical protein UABAM_00198 [Candidatus Uabimicrobium amorphum]